MLAENQLALIRRWSMDGACDGPDRQAEEAAGTEPRETWTEKQVAAAPPHAQPDPVRASRRPRLFDKPARSATA